MQSRQVRRQEERRAQKPAPATIEMTSRRHLSRSKGKPFSRCLIKNVAPGMSGVPATFVLFHPTKGNYHVKKATPALLDVFYPGIGSQPDFANALLGRY
jgi:hypothetical protein